MKLAIAGLAEGNLSLSAIKEAAASLDANTLKMLGLMQTLSANSYAGVALGIATTIQGFSPELAPVTDYLHELANSIRRGLGLPEFVEPGRGAAHPADHGRAPNRREGV